MGQAPEPDLTAPVRFAVRIAGTATVLPGRAIPTSEIVTHVTPPRDAADVIARTGITSRRFAHPDDSPAALGAEALRRALEAANLRADALDRLIFVTSGGGDLLFPATANLVAAHLGLRGSCDCFDLNNASISGPRH